MTSAATDETAPRPETASAERTGDESFSAEKSALEARHQRACLIGQGPAGRDELLLSYRGDAPLIELRAAGRVLLSGRWGWELNCNGVERRGESQWDWCCWNSDEDGDYLELQREWPDGLKWERQLFLSRNHHWLFLSDCISGLNRSKVASGRQGRTAAQASGAKSARLRSLLPWGDRLQAETVTGSREVAVRTVKRTVSSPPGTPLRRTPSVARLFPVALPQDCSFSSDGRIEADERSVTVELTSPGETIYCPLILDWNPTRMRGPADWNRLTVSEEGTVLNGDQAAGYRLRLGSAQWLIYRSLQKSVEGRCLLGYHTRFESVVGLVQTDGTIKPMVQIEQS